MVSKISEKLKIITEKGWTCLGTCLVILDGFPEEMKENEVMNHLKDNLMLSQYNEVVFTFLITRREVTEPETGSNKKVSETGSRKEVTEPETRSNKKVYRIEPLSDDDSSSLLGNIVKEMGKKVKEKDQGHPDFETLHKEIAKKSKGGLPDIKTLYEEIAKKSEGLPAIILMIAAALSHIEEHDFDSRVWMLKGALDEPESTLLG